ncbi:MAG: HlyD family efflux transporter periplasmic adaptor subunit [Planctomyces sp.]|nr:HlyD family efflux transporter periplasmic adaptor subunit [Planctomyces sp.]
MTATAEQPTAIARRFTLRADLQIEPQIYAGELSYVIKDPVSLNYFRFRPAEHDILRLLTGRTIDELRQAIERRQAGPAPAREELERFLQSLAESGLVVFSGGGQGEMLLAHARSVERAQRRSWMGSLLYVKFPGVDPEPVLSRLYPLVKWMYRPWAVITALAFIAGTIAYNLVHADTLVERFREESLGQFFSAETLLWLWVAIGVSKVLHEFGHGLTCRHFGGECHDMGMLLLVFSPCLYCDASDAWTMPSKWRRMAISAGGIYVELLIASFASLVWWSTTNGVVHNIALALMTICSLNTFLLNANPLMRFDGYYLLSDLLEIPNLRGRAQAALQGWIDRTLLGLPPSGPTEPLTARRRVAFVMFAIAAWLYRWLLCISILWFFYHVLKPHGLGNVSLVLAALVGCQLFVIPLWRTVMRVSRAASRPGGLKWGRLGLTTAIVAGLGYAAVVVPVPRRVSAAFVLQARDQLPVQVPVAGRLESIEVRPGQTVQQGDVIARLSNPDLELQVAELQTSIRTMRLLSDQHLAAGRPAEAEAVLEILKPAEEQLESLWKRQQQLTIVAQRDGLVAPPAMQINVEIETRGYRELGGWQQMPLRDENLGSRLSVGTTVCDLHPSSELEAVLFVEQSEVPTLEVGSPVRLKLDAFPMRVFEGQVREISQQDADDPPRQLLVDGGGTVPTIRAADGSAQMWTTHYMVRVAFNPSDTTEAAELQQALWSGCRGRAKVRCGKTTCWKIVSRKLHQTFFF